MKFIFEVIVKPGFTAEQYATNWIRASEIIQQTPGALGTRCIGTSTIQTGYWL